ncbi:MAG: 1-acyl-sn-glycerol-3-phosphate acyltransferase [Oscillospiraceae bacterium]|nr:1-acyl-sn-glycerol-3-phosphate acyltransferase [Oscillospiraceae bacterium]
MRTVYLILYCIAWPFFNLVHPCRAIGREHIPEGAALVCANHTRLSDPLFIVFAFHRQHQLRAMAKAEFMSFPVLGWLLKQAGIFGVERGKSDVSAIKTAMKFLKSGEKVLLFPEGTRHKDGEAGDAKTGAAMLAVRTGAPIVPVYVPAKKRWFRRTPVVIGAPFTPQIQGKRGTAEEYRAIAEELMERICALEELAV